MVNARGNDAQVVKISLARDYPQPSERGSDLDHSERDGVAVTVDGVDAVGPPCGLEISERRKEHLGLARKGGQPMQLRSNRHEVGTNKLEEERVPAERVAHSDLQLGSGGHESELRATQPHELI